MTKQADFDKELLEEIDEMCQHMDETYHTILDLSESVRSLADDIVRIAEGMRKDSKTFEVFNEFIEREIWIGDLEWKDLN